MMTTASSTQYMQFTACFRMCVLSGRFEYTKGSCLLEPMHEESAGSSRCMPSLSEPALIVELYILCNIRACMLALDNEDTPIGR